MTPKRDLPAIQAEITFLGARMVKCDEEQKSGAGAQSDKPLSKLEIAKLEADAELPLTFLTAFQCQTCVFMTLNFQAQRFCGLLSHMKAPEAHILTQAEWLNPQPPERCPLRRQTVLVRLRLP